ncbi:hypothetical protein FRC12_010150 [Ceratobasidium sp. 428]|nr:hypothetical protein FRC12_010150 [Ceratobasidium sp. 428]
MSPWSHSYGGMQQLRTFSLASYADPLPNLRCLHGPLPILSGILENPRACPFLTTLVDSLNRRVEQSALDNLLQLMEHASLTSLRRLRVCVPQIQTGIFQRLSKASPGVQVLEIQSYGSELGDISTEDTQISHKLIETITLGLNQFPQLHTIGGNITQIYHEACAKITGSPVTPLSFSKHLLKLLEAVPKIRFVHIGNGALFVVDRKPDQTLKLTGFECMNNSDHDWSSSRLWKTRPISQEEEESRRKAEYMDVYEELLKGVEPAEPQQTPTP